MFLSTFEKPVDAKRRLVVPQEFRVAALLAQGDIEAFDGVYAIAAIGAECIECGGPAFFSAYRDVINEYPPLSPVRKALATRFYASMQKLNFDAAGRITLPEALCQRFALEGEVLLTGIGESFQIWNPKAFAAHAQGQEALILDAMQKRGVA